MTDAFDADVLIFAAHGDPRGDAAYDAIAGGGELVGSLLLLPETLSRPMRLGDDTELSGLGALLARLDLKPVDREVARAATQFAAEYRLRAADAVHLATAVVWGAERFHTNNRRDFAPGIREIEIVLPPDPSEGI